MGIVEFAALLFIVIVLGPAVLQLLGLAWTLLRVLFIAAAYLFGAGLLVAFVVAAPEVAGMLLLIFAVITTAVWIVTDYLEAPEPDSVPALPAPDHVTDDEYELLDRIQGAL